MAPKLARICFTASLFYLSLGLAGCGGGGGSVAPSPAPPAIKVSISPSTASVAADSTQQFTATVANTTNKQVTWAVSGVTGGNGTVGTISAQGLYTAPDPLPDPASVTVTATSQADSTKSASANVSMTYPTPNISGITPASTPLNSGDTVLTVNGSGFTKASSVDFGGASLAASYLSSKQLTATVPSSSETTAQAYSLSVTNPSPGGGTSNSVNFTVENPAPVVTSITPSVLAAGSPDTSVVVNGGDFTSGSQIELNGSPLSTTFISSTQLSTTVTSDNLVNAGTAQITVVTPGPGGGTSASVQLDVTVVASLVALATPKDGGSPNGPWQIVVAAVDPSGNSIANLPIVLSATDGTLDQTQGQTDSSGTFSATISPPSANTGQAVAVTATTGAQTAAVDIGFASTPSTTSTLSMARQAFESQHDALSPSSTSTSTSTPMIGPTVFGVSGNAGSTPPFSVPNECYSNLGLTRVPSTNCQSTFNVAGVVYNAVDFASSVCTTLDKYAGIAECAGTAVAGAACLTGVGAVVCAAGVYYFGVPCLKFVATELAKQYGGPLAALLLKSGLTGLEIAIDPTNPDYVVDIGCTAINSADFGLASGSSGTSFTVSPPTAVVPLGGKVQFTASASANWSVVQGPEGGSITSTGLYTAPTTMPFLPEVTIDATSASDSTAVAQEGVTLVSSTGGASGSAAIITGLEGGQLVDKAYVPVPSSNLVSVVNLDAAQGTNPVITTIPTPNSYSPNATAADQLRSEVLAISYSSPVIQVIDASHDVLVTTLTSPVTTSVGFSGGSCMVCGITVDPASNKAILDTAQGYLTLDLSSLTFSPFLPAAPAENFGYDPNGSLVLSPTYGVSSFTGLQLFNVLGGNIFNFSSSLGSNPDAAAVDINTGIVAVPDEYTGDQYLINMQGAQLSSTTAPPSFTTPSTVFHINFTNCGSELYDWSLVSAESSSHLLFLGTEFADCAAVESLPVSPFAGSPPLPAVFKWGHMPIRPDGFSWNNGGDPHGIAVFSSVVDGKSYGFLVSDDANWVARIDLSALAGAPALSGGGANEVDLSPYVVFFNTQ